MKSASKYACGVYAFANHNSQTVAPRWGEVPSGPPKFPGKEKMAEERASRNAGEPDSTARPPAMLSPVLPVRFFFTMAFDKTEQAALVSFRQPANFPPFKSRDFVMTYQKSRRVGRLAVVANMRAHRTVSSPRAARGQYRYECMRRSGTR